MSEQKTSKGWAKLDNVAKVFPSTTEKTDTRVFRFSCRLREEVIPAALQAALELAIREFPHFLCVIRRGMFWYYFERTDIKPVVTPEVKPPCDALYINGRKNLLFEVTYFDNRINLEVFHSLTDGTGAMQFLKAIVYHYLKLTHGEELGEIPPLLDDLSSVSDKAHDDFDKYYSNKKTMKLPKSPRAYNIHDMKRENDDLVIIEGRVSVKAMLAKSHEYHTTITSLIAAVLTDAIHKSMTVADEKLPIAVAFPVNLRRFFPSGSARNFFGMLDASYNYSERDGSFEDVIEKLHSEFNSKLNAEYLSAVMNANSALEHNTAIRLAPLPFKNFVIRSVRHISDKTCTTSVSNIGIIKMPDELSRYIEDFSFYTSTLALQICVCSFGDSLVIGFSSSFAPTEIQMNFFRKLSELGVEPEIWSNI